MALPSGAGLPRLPWKKTVKPGVLVCYLREGGYVFIFLSLLGALHKNFQTDLHDIYGEGCQ